MVLPRLSVLKVVSRTTLPMLFRHHFQRRSTIYKIKMDSAVRNMKLYLFCKGHYYFLRFYYLLFPIFTRNIEVKMLLTIFMAH